MKTKEELNAIKNETETLNKKLAELTEEELAQVTGGYLTPDPESDFIEPPSMSPPSLSASPAVSGGGTIWTSDV